MLYVKELVIIVLLAAVMLLSGADILHDYSEGAGVMHLSIELLLLTVSLALIALLGVEVGRQARSNRRLKAELQALSGNQLAAASQEMQEARHRLAEVAQRQFAEWELTQTEKEVAMLLLKGLSFKEIAAVRDTLEKTVRQQASSVYRKSGLNGRHAFSAWFIEDFL